MSSISPIRVTGLSGNFDMEGIIEASMIRDKEKVDKAKQEQQIVKWKQEIYRN
ncbi:flagellar cap protein FliD, partial [Clostridioides difficile]|nr:flagellar cap protein FliD [Clostridioides difficile]